MKTCFQTSTISSAMFITAMAANPLAVDLARDSIGKTISWGLWAAAGLVPGLICLATAPLILYVLYPPEVKDTPDAPVRARWVPVRSCQTWAQPGPTSLCCVVLFGQAFTCSAWRGKLTQAWTSRLCLALALSLLWTYMAIFLL